MRLLSARRLFSARPRVAGVLDGRVGRLTIENAGKRNAMTLQMYSDVPRAVAAVASARVSILRGLGPEAFGAGSDIAEFPGLRTGARQAAAYSRVERAASESLRALPHPVLAAVHGPCIGGGLNLALAADLRGSQCLRRSFLDARRGPACRTTRVEGQPAA